jgi:hypothetical protein
MKHSCLAALPLLLLASSCITEPICACSPVGGGDAIITGYVTNPEMQAVENATVNVRLLMDNCSVPDTLIVRTSRTGPTGRFRHKESWAGGYKCFRVWAEPPPGSALVASDGENVRIEYLREVFPDSIELHLQLR